MRGYAPFITFILLTVTFIGLPFLVEAQCSMCRAVTNSNRLSDDAFIIGNGLNNAIVYLMFMPYIMGALFFYAFYRKQIKAWFRAKFSA
jgi:hypothetical protein